MLSFTIETQGLEQIAKILVSRTTDLRPQLEVIGEDLINAVQDAFKSGNFQALAPSTVKFKLSKGKTAAPLIFNGTWRRQHRSKVGDDFVEVVTDVPYAVFHVSDKPRTKIPLRNPYDLSPSGALGSQDVLEDAASRLAHFIATGEVT